MDRGSVMLVAGGVLLAAGFVAASWWESSQRPDPILEFPVSFSEQFSPVVVDEGHLEEGDNETYAFRIDDLNVSWTETRLVWEEDSGEVSTFRVNVTSPWGQTWTNETRDEVVVVRVDVVEVPQGGWVNATGVGEADASAFQRFASERGMGLWEVEVTLVEAPGQRPIPGSSIETRPDGDNSYDLQFRYAFFEGTVGGTPRG